MLKPHLPAINDREGDRLPDDLPAVADAHVHVFPPELFRAVWQWFDEHAWPIRYRLETSQVFEFIIAHGLRHIVALQYAHKPGIAEALNRYMADACREYAGRVTGMATVFPGEANADRILREAFDMGLGGLKLHAHVQCFDMNADDMLPLYDLCQTRQKPIVMHVGREPRSTAYLCDPYDICSVDRLERVLAEFPALKICVPHLGIDELAAYRRLIAQYDNLWLDTAMVLTDYFPLAETVDLRDYRTDRIMYGSDFPNIPYAWDRELKWLRAAGLEDETLAQVLLTNASRFYGFAI